MMSNDDNSEIVDSEIICNDDSIDANKLISLLENVKELVLNDELSNIEKGMLKEELNSFIKHDHGIDKETTSCLFWGWWIRNHLREAGIDIDSAQDDNN